MNTAEEVKRKPNPRANSNFISSLFFLYMIPIFYSSFKKDFTERDLSEPLEEHKSVLLGNKLDAAWRRYSKKYNKWSLHFAIFRVFGCQLILVGLLTLIKELISIIFIPYLIGKLVSFFAQTTQEITHKEAYYFAAALILTMVVERMISHPTFMWTMHLGMKIRVGCNALIYRKMLRLSKNALAHTTVGHIVNLASNDVSKFDQYMPLVHFSWVSPIQTAVGVYFLYLQIGVACFFGVGFLLLLLPLQIFIAKRTMVLRLRTALLTDERVRLMNEIISGIQVIKIYVWEKSFAKLVAKIRSKELQTIRSNKVLRAITYAIESSASRISIFISIVAYVLLGNQVTAQTAFGVTAVYNVLKIVVSYLFTMGLAGIAEMNVSMKRIKKFLEYEEIPQKVLPLAIEYKSYQSPENKNINKLSSKVVLKEMNAKWNKDSVDNILSNISFNIAVPQLLTVIGPVGSGKSSLLNAILSEMSISGKLQVEGDMSYCPQEPWLFSESVRDNILFGERYNEKRYRKTCKVCELETDFAQFPHGDKTLVGEKGRALSGGQKARINLARCVYKQADIYLLDDPLSAVDANVGKKLFNNCIKGYLHDKIIILITHQLQYLQQADQILIMEEGRTSALGTYEEMQNSGVDFAHLLQDIHTDEHSQEKKSRGIMSRQNSINSEISDDALSITKDNFAEEPMIEKEKLSHGVVSINTYRNYFRAGGSFFVLLAVFGAYVTFEVVSRLGDYFIAYWLDKEDTFTSISQNNTSDNITYIDVDSERLLLVYEFSGIIILTAFLGVFCNVVAFYFLMRSSKNLHNYIFEQSTRAKMYFFNTNPVGRILNKFSMDMGIIDDLLPTIVVEVVRIAMILFGTLLLTIIVNAMVVIPALVLLVIFYLLRIVYVGTSRNIKRIEAIARSPIYNQMTTTMNGLTVIRAFSAEEIVIQEFDRHQDLHSSAWFLFISSTRAFGFWLDMVCVIFLGVVTLTLLAFNSSMHGGTLGLIITQFMGLMGAIQWGMRQWSELENQMTSVERVLEYTKLDNEPERDDNGKLPSDWPTGGKLEFQNVSMCYTDDEPPVLKDLNFIVHAGEKVGIVGRTGAGKSSIINCLFQLYNTEGAIFIDKVNTTKLPLSMVRSKISIIPQEPILFSGTMRKNLDPFDEYEDSALWNALEHVELKEVIAEMPQGLHTNIMEGGSNYSVGQRQLVCLARAIIRNNRILVMDEATANVDPHTDSLIQKTIRKQFNTCTVLTIAHRLHTVMDSDKILVMDAGKITEFDSPHNLLQKEAGIFKDMVLTSGTIVQDQEKL